MTVLPIVERELRVASRRRSTIRTRFYVALASILVVLVALVAGAADGVPAETGRALFDVLGVLILFFCACCGPFLTGDCLSVEKRQGTLGLLFLTDLSSWDIVFGKLAATSSVATYAILAAVPMLGLPLLMGGVTVAEFWRVILVMLVTLLFSLGAGMCVSAACREARTAMLGSFGVLLLLMGGGFLAGSIICWEFKANWGEYLTFFNPFYALAAAHDGFISTGSVALSVPPYETSVSLLGGAGLLQLMVGFRSLAAGEAPPASKAGAGPAWRNQEARVAA